MKPKMMIDSNLAEQRMAAGDFRGPGLFEVNHADGSRSVTNVRRLAGADREPGSMFIGAGTIMLGLLGAGLLYVSFSAQFTYIFAAKHQHAASIIQALMLDVGMVIFAVLGLGLSKQGKPSRVERTLIMVCALLSAAMNYAASDTASPRSVVAYTAAPVFLAIVTDRVIAVVRRHVLGIDEASAWASLGRALKGCARVLGFILLYGLRFILAAPETASGLRRVVLNTAPLPGLPAVQALALPLPDDQDGPSQSDQDDCYLDRQGGDVAFDAATDHFLYKYRRHDEYGDRSAAARVGALIAPLCELRPGTGRVLAFEELDRRDEQQEKGGPVFGSKKDKLLHLYRQHAAYGDRELASRTAAELASLAELQPGTARTYVYGELDRIAARVEGRAS